MGFSLAFESQATRAQAGQPFRVLGEAGLRRRARQALEAWAAELGVRVPRGRHGTAVSLSFSSAE